jgi:nucleotide-binding universal stress UspA family protein
MYRHILIPTDGSDLSVKAVQHGVKLARVLGSRVTFFSSTKPLSSLGDLEHAFGGTSESFKKQALEYLQSGAREALRAASEVATAADVTAEGLTVESEHPYEAIIDAAKSRDADLIVMASHGRSGVKAALLGSVTQKVLAHTDLPVLVCR